MEQIFCQLLAEDLSLWHNTLMSKRWIFFLIAVVLGIAGGLFYGWVLNPVDYVDTTPNTLRIDFKADYVLMVAEAYQKEADLSLTARRLALLGGSPQAQIEQAIQFGLQYHYPKSDMAVLQQLALGMQKWTPEASSP